MVPVSGNFSRPFRQRCFCLSLRLEQKADQIGRFLFAIRIRSAASADLSLAAGSLIFECRLPNATQSLEHPGSRLSNRRRVLQIIF
jgi:hypothetical protein